MDLKVELEREDDGRWIAEVGTSPAFGIWDDGSRGDREGAGFLLWKC